MRWGGLLLGLYVWLTLGFIFAPILASFVFSFNSDRFPSLPLGSFSLTWYQAILDDPGVWQGLRNSVLTAVCAGSIATLLGFGAAYTDYRYKFLGKNLYLALALLPPTIPFVILGLAMLAFYARIGLSGELTAVIVSHVVICTPFAMALVRLRLSQIDPDLEAAAWNMGAGEAQALRYVILPFCAPAILAALLLTMAVSFDEYTIAWFVSGLNETLPVRVLSFLQGQVSPRINAIGSLVFTVSIVLVVSAQLLMRNRKGEPS